MLNIKAFSKKRNIYGWLFVLPTAVSLLLFIVYPVFFSVILSLSNVRSNISALQIKGFDNYKWLFSSYGKEFWEGIGISLQFSFASTLLQTVLGFLIAYMLYNLGKGVQSVFKVLIYLPVILPGALVAILWKFIFAHDIGMIDRLLAVVGVSNPPMWLVSEGWAMTSVIVANTWRFVGITVILYFVSMNSLSGEMLESAKLDGAGKARILWNFIVPLTFSMTKVNIIMSFVGGIKSFDLFFLLTQGQGHTTVVGMVIYRMAFEKNILSLASTMGIVLTSLLSVLVYIGNFSMDRVDRRVS